MNPSAKSRLRRWLVLVASVVVLLAGIPGAAVFFYQDVLLWHPRPYGAGRIAAFPRPLVPLEFRTAQGRETAFYARRAMAARCRRRRCACFSLATVRSRWTGETLSPPTPRQTGRFCSWITGLRPVRGQAVPGVHRAKRHRRAGRARAAARPAGRGALERSLTAGGRLMAMGHSMGTGVALAFAASCPAVDRVVLVAPFVSLRAMARRTVGWPLSLALRGNFDNLARLDDLAARAVPPRVLVFHGDRDSLIPPAMGRALAATHPGFVRYEPVAGATHDNVVARALPRLLGTLDAR